MKKKHTTILFICFLLGHKKNWLYMNLFPNWLLNIHISIGSSCCQLSVVAEYIWAQQFVWSKSRFFLLRFKPYLSSILWTRAPQWFTGFQIFLKNNYSIFALFCLVAIYFRFTYMQNDARKDFQKQNYVFLYSIGIQIILKVLLFQSDKKCKSM